MIVAPAAVAWMGVAIVIVIAFSIVILVVIVTVKLQCERLIVNLLLLLMSPQL